jgi:putative MFS transporter
VRAFERAGGIDPAAAPQPGQPGAAASGGADGAGGKPGGQPGAAAPGGADGAGGKPGGQPGAAASSKLSALFGGGLARRTAAIWAVWFCVNFAYYGAFTWLPTLLVADGITVTKSLGYTLIITLAQLPGYACAAWLIERLGRRATLTVFLIGSAASAGLFALAGSPGEIIGAGMLLSFFNLGAWGALYAATPEIYPTPLRGTGAGWAAGFGRVASIVTTLATMPLHAALGTGPVFALFAGFFLLAAAAAWGLPEMRGRALAEG